MRVLVTGGTGYIGERLLRQLSADAGFDVTAATRTPRGKGAVAIDWSDRASLQALARGRDAVVHLAAMNERACERDPQAALRVNVLGTFELLQACQSAGVRRFLYLSTIKVFGENPRGVLTEEALPRPQNHYAMTHRAAEDYVLAARASRGIEGIVYRLSNAFGHPLDPDAGAWMLIANDLCRQAATSGRIVLHSSGLAWRNFVPMADVIAAIQHALEMPEDLLSDGLFHLGTERVLRILDLAELVAERAREVLGIEPVISAPPRAPQEDPQELDWRIDKLIRTGWKPRSSLREEIDATLRFCSGHFRAEVRQTSA